MFAIAISTLIGFGLGMALVELFDPFNDGDEDSEPTPEPLPTTDVFLVGNGETVTGTDDDDSFALIEGENYINPIVVDGGAGNDVLDLTDPTGEAPSFDSGYGLDRVIIAGGDGDDMIDIAASSSTIDGGAGNDVINVALAGGSTVTGGDGDDTLTGTLVAQDGAIFDGGAGNDLIDGRGIENALLRGGAGNDTILISGFNQGGAGYVICADGGDGDDTIRFDGAANVNPGFEPQTALGGAGNDTFELRFNEGGALPESTTGDSVELGLITLGDFVPGEDVMSVEPYRVDDGFTISEASLVENTETGLTRLILTYDHPTEIDRDVVITIRATGMTWDDITFIGDSQPATLVPVI